jgi:hypothetical protein
MSKGLASPSWLLRLSLEVQMAKMDWRRNKHSGRAREAAFAPPPAKKGCWSHIKREPVRTFTAAEIADWRSTSEGGAQ